MFVPFDVISASMSRMLRINTSSVSMKFIEYVAELALVFVVVAAAVGNSIF